MTTTGKFEECQSDDEDGQFQQQEEEEEAARIGSTLRQLEAVPAGVDSAAASQGRRVQIHVSYEDTNEYADYAKWYADVHGCSPSNVAADEYQQYLRRWYHWYRTAVKFVDVEPLSDDGGEGDADDDANPVDYAGCQYFADASTEASEEDQCRRLMEQWRWQRIHEWELKTRNQTAAAGGVVQETSTDGVSVSAKPVAYSAAPSAATGVS